MANYSTLLKSWGASGSEFPDGYSYIEGEQPVDDWDNFVTSNLIGDTQHLISLTNSRIESSYGSTLPTSGEDGELFYHTGEKSLYRYQTDSSQWKDFALDEDLTAHTGDTSNPHNVSLEQARAQDPVVSGNISMGSSSLIDVASIDSASDSFSIQTSGSGTGSIVLQDSANGANLIKANEGGAVNIGSGPLSEQGNRVATRMWVNAKDWQVDVSEDGTTLVSDVGDINFQGFLNAIDDGDGTVSIDPTHNHDGRYVMESGDTMTGNLTMSHNKVTDVDEIRVRDSAFPSGDYINLSSVDTATASDSGEALALEYYDSSAATSESLATFNRGGPVEFHNDTNISGLATLSGGASLGANMDLGENTVTNVATLKAGASPMNFYTGGNSVNVYDSTNGQYVLRTLEGGSVRVPNGNLRLATGQAIEDGSGTNRFALSSSVTSLTDENGNPRFEASQNFAAKIKARNGSPFVVTDVEGGFDALQYTTAASAPGALEATNAEIRQGAASASNSWRMRFLNGNANNIDVYNGGGELVADDPAGNSTTLTNSNGGTVVSSSSEYEIQKNGTDGAGIINFKT